MASSNTFPLLLLLITLSSLHCTRAREVKSFNKAAAATTNTVSIPNSKEPQTNQPDFLPENENGYGLYGHESGQLPPSATENHREPATANKYLPKNYNPVAYVTQPDTAADNTASFTEANSFRSNPEINDNNYYNGAESYYNNQHETEAAEYRSRSRGNRNNNYYYNLGSSFNSNPQLYGRGGGASNHDGSFERKGMSDTRFMENGKYYYDVNTDKYSSNHPYESLKGARARNEYNNRNYYGNNENTYEYNGGNSMGGYQNQDDFQDEEHNMP